MRQVLKAGSNVPPFVLKVNLGLNGALPDIGPGLIMLLATSCAAKLRVGSTVVHIDCKKSGHFPHSFRFDGLPYSRFLYSQICIEPVNGTETIEEVKLVMSACAEEHVPDEFNFMLGGTMCRLDTGQEDV